MQCRVTSTVGEVHVVDLFFRDTFGFQNFDCDPIFLRILGNRWLSVPPDSILGDSSQKSEGGLSGLCGVFWALDYSHPVPNESHVSSKSQDIQAEGTHCLLNFGM